MRNIFIVDANIVDANGNYSTINGFPKRFDSRSYSDSTETALRRAKAAYYTQLGLNYAIDGRQMQTVTQLQADGRIIMRESEGRFIEPEPEPEPEPTPEPEPEPVENPEEPVGE